jgi:DNA-binding transcriptional LysR family regulator
MALSLARVRAVNAVYEAGNFSAAARRLGMSPPAITQLIRDMEREYGVSLFDRRGHGLVPTAVCEDLRSAAVRLRASEEEAVAILTRHQDLKAGGLRIGLGNAMPGMAMIGGFQRHYPTITLSVEMGSWADIIAAVAEQRVDVGLLPDVPDDGRFRREVCLHQRVVAIVHPDDPFATEREVGCAALAERPLVFRTKSSSTQRVVDRAFRGMGLTPKPAIVLDTRDGVFEAVANRLGIGFMWEHGSSRTDRLKKIPVTEIREAMPEHVFCLNSRKDRLVDLFFQSRLGLAPSTARQF